MNVHPQVFYFGIAWGLGGSYDDTAHSPYPHKTRMIYHCIIFNKMQCNLGTGGRGALGNGK